MIVGAECRYRRLCPVAGTLLPHRRPDLLVGVRDVALELLFVGLAQDRLLVGLRELAEQEQSDDVRPIAPTAALL
jgi:hypothetical protein